MQASGPTPQRLFSELESPYWSFGFMEKESSLSMNEKPKRHHSLVHLDCVDTELVIFSLNFKPEIFSRRNQTAGEFQTM